MTERKIKTMYFDGTPVQIEVTNINIDESQIPTEEDSKSPLDHLEHTSTTEEKILSAGDTVRDTIAALSKTVNAGISATKPAEWTLEINLGFDGKLGLPYIAEGGVNGAVKVSVKWKLDQEDGNAGA